MTAALLLAILLGPGPAALPRTPAEQATLTALAGSLGRAHALHRLCTGPQDDLWRSRMNRMLAVERPEAALRQRLVDAFNSGFAAGGEAFPQCSVPSRAALSQAEHEAAEQARRLSGPAPGP